MEDYLLGGSVSKPIGEVFSAHQKFLRYAHFKFDSNCPFFGKEPDLRDDTPATIAVGFNPEETEKLASLVPNGRTNDWMHLGVLRDGVTKGGDPLDMRVAAYPDILGINFIACFYGVNFCAY